MSDLIEKVEEAIGFNIDHDAFEGENPTRRFYQYSAKAAIKTVLREMDKEADEMKIEHKKLIVKLFVGVFAESHNIDIEGSRDMRSKDCA